VSAINETLARVEHSFKDVYLQLLSVIQGLALSGLAFAVSTAYQHLALAEWLRVVVVFLVIVAAWQEYMVGATVFAWVPTVLDSMVPFILGAVEFALASVIASPMVAYLMMMSVTSATGLAAYANYAYHAHRGFPSNASSYHFFHPHVRFGLIVCTAATVFNTLLWLAAWVFKLHGASDEIILAVLTALMPVSLIAHFIPHWNGAIKRARRSLVGTRSRREEG
jgi:hypothetical protein